MKLNNLDLVSYTTEGDRLVCVLVNATLTQIDELR